MVATSETERKKTYIYMCYRDKNPPRNQNNIDDLTDDSTMRKSSDFYFIFMSDS